MKTTYIIRNRREWTMRLHDQLIFIENEKMKMGQRRSAVVPIHNSLMTKEEWLGSKIIQHEKGIQVFNPIHNR